jgi:hypothetical protein
MNSGSRHSLDTVSFVILTNFVIHTISVLLLTPHLFSFFLSSLVNRMRGYLGYSMKDSWYGWLERKDAVREYKYPVGNYGAREWPIGWIGIDGDTLIEHELVPVGQSGEIIEAKNTNQAKKEKARNRSSGVNGHHLILRTTATVTSIA